MNRFAELDRRFVWHPFTQMRDWMQREPIVIESGKGTVLRDTEGREYIDANSSIWTNLHGHAHPKINAAISNQLERIAHSSALGFANEPASLLAERLIELANPPLPRSQPKLTKVFYSDDGSTGMEVALKLAYEFTRRTGRSKRPRFLSLENAYHGDTVGAVSLGHVDLFHKAYSGLLFRSDKVMAPYCYRCPFNKAKPQPGDARTYRKCRWECVAKVGEAFEKRAKKGGYAAMIVEPRIQGVAGMVAHPVGWLKRVAKIVRRHGALLIADEVMTGFGRTGSNFASHAEKVQPDLLVVAKGLTGGYTPMAATLTTQPIFDAFLGDYADFKTFFHGHSFTGNQVGAAAALASLDILTSKKCAAQRSRLEKQIGKGLKNLANHPNVGDIRQSGCVAGIELVADRPTRKSFPLESQIGIRVCEAMSKRGVLTRPIGNVIVIMPPYCTTKVQLWKTLRALERVINDTLKAW